MLAERERRRQRELEGALGTTAGELGGAREDAAALVGQLQLAEGAVATAEGALGAGAPRHCPPARPPACPLHCIASHVVVPLHAHPAAPTSCVHAGEASALRGQLAAVQEQLERAAGECERLREEAVNTNARWAG